MSTQSPEAAAEADPYTTAIPILPHNDAGAQTVWSNASVSQTQPDCGGSTQRPKVRIATLLWSIILLLVGALCLATGLGARIDPELAASIILSGAGAVLLLVALLLPRRHRSAAKHPGAVSQPDAAR